MRLKRYSTTTRNCVPNELKVAEEVNGRIPRPWMIKWVNLWLQRKNIQASLYFWNWKVNATGHRLNQSSSVAAACRSVYPWIYTAQRQPYYSLSTVRWIFFFLIFSFKDKYIQNLFIRSAPFDRTSVLKQYYIILVWLAWQYYLTTPI